MGAQILTLKLGNRQYLGTMLVVSFPQQCTRVAKPAGNRGGLAKKLQCGRTL